MQVEIRSSGTLLTVTVNNKKSKGCEVNRPGPTVAERDKMQVCNSPTLRIACSKISDVIFQLQVWLAGCYGQANARISDFSYSKLPDPPMWVVTTKVPMS